MTFILATVALFYVILGVGAIGMFFTKCLDFVLDFGFAPKTNKHVRG